MIKSLLTEWAQRTASPADAERVEAVETQARGITRLWHWAFNSIRGNLYLLTIGNSDFRGRAGNLPACRSDARMMADVYKSYGADVREMHNLWAAAMWAEIERALSRLGSGKTVVIHVSSHGTQIRDANRDEADGKDEAICGSDMGLIGDDEIFTRCNGAVRSKGGNLVLIFDTCHSGGMHRAAGELCGVRNVPATMIPEGEVEAFIRRKRDLQPVSRGELPYAVLMACEERTYAYDGVFTPSLVRVLRASGNAYAGQVLARVRDRVRNQTPQFAGQPKIRMFG